MNFDAVPGFYTTQIPSFNAVPDSVKVRLMPHFDEVVSAFSEATFQSRRSFGMVRLLAAYFRLYFRKSNPLLRELYAICMERCNEGSRIPVPPMVSSADVMRV